jgi:hypothetical protein
LIVFTSQVLGIHAKGAKVLDDIDCRLPHNSAGSI